MNKTKILNVKGLSITTFKINDEDFISLTDIARKKNIHEPKDVVKNWMRSKTTIEFLSLWEQLNNPYFKGVEIDPFLHEAGSNAFTLLPSRWIEATNAKGLISKQGNNGGTFAHKDIAFEFASWVSSGFKLYLIKEFQRLKMDESEKLNIEWNIQRTLAKVNYHIHTDAIKENLIPKELSKKEASLIYANEADILNKELFGKTILEWKKENPKRKGNIRDYATVEQLVVLTNPESINSILISQNLPQSKRLLQLNEIAIKQLRVLIHHSSIQKLK